VAGRNSQPGQSQCPAARDAISSEGIVTIQAVNSTVKALSSGKVLSCITETFCEVQVWGRRNSVVRLEADTTSLPSP